MCWFFFILTLQTIIHFMSRIEELMRASIARPVIGNEHSTFCAIDLSENALNNESFDIGNAGSFENFIESHCKNLNSDFAIGGYKEKRNIYKRSSYAHYQIQKACANLQ